MIIPLTALDHEQQKAVVRIRLSLAVVHDPAWKMGGCNTTDEQRAEMRRVAGEDAIAFLVSLGLIKDTK